MGSMREVHGAAGEIVSTRRELADRVCAELRLAGLPASPGSGVAGEAEVVGAVVEVDLGDDAAGGVFVHWQPDPGLTSAVVESMRNGQVDADAVRHSGSIKAHMRDAIIGILRSAGLRVEVERDDMRPFTVRILGP